MVTRGHVILWLPGQLGGRPGGRHGADVGVVVLEAGAVSQLRPHAPQCRELVCNEDIVKHLCFVHDPFYQLNLDCSQL